MMEALNSGGMKKEEMERGSICVRFTKNTRCHGCRFFSNVGGKCKSAACVYSVPGQLHRAKKKTLQRRMRW